MCDKCAKAVEQLKKKGYSDTEIDTWMWENTAFPFDPPTKAQVDAMIPLKKITK